MARQWYHEVSLDWLKARADYITATEIAKLVPAYKRARKKLDANPGLIVPEFAALWAEKNTPGQFDPVSYGPAARGHVMEPWAVGSYNAYLIECEEDTRFFHWDDILITDGKVGFSPDALNIPMALAGPLLTVNGKMLTDGEAAIPMPKEAMEIKAYEAAHHMKCCIKTKEEHDELIQVATAFHVLKQLEAVTLCFYNPDAPIAMHVERYERDELEEQLDMVKGIVELWDRTKYQCTRLGAEIPSKVTEEQIYQDMLRRQAEEKSDHSFNF